jgi:sigma-B regulation protein RsbU (phosphoserine phosphatase)
MREVNEYLRASTPEDTFLTLFLGVLDGASGRLRYVSGGHPSPVVLSGPTAREPRRLTGGGPVLGVFAGADFEEGHVSLLAGSLLAVFSDGLTETLDEEGRQFRRQRVVETLRAVRSGSAVQILEHLLEVVECFRGRRKSADDLSVILLHRLR